MLASKTFNPPPLPPAILRANPRIGCGMVPPLRSGTAGGTLEARHRPAANNDFQETRMAVTRIDCDIHPAVGGTRTTLLPYLDDHWKEQVVSRAIDGLDLTSYPPNMPLSGRADWRPANAKPGSDLAMVQRGAFDQLGASHAICNVLYGAQAVYDPYMAAAFCKAINDWIATEWLARDPRLRASIVIPLQAPDLAIEEIERRAGDNRFVSVLVLAQGESLLGRRRAFWAVRAAAREPPAAARDPCRQPVSPGAEFDRLAVLSLRILSGGSA